MQLIPSKYPMAQDGLHVYLLLLEIQIIFSLPLTLPRTIAKVWFSETHLLGLLDTNLLDLESSDSYWLHERSAVINMPLHVDI